jgi:hypothetical protein
VPSGGGIGTSVTLQIVGFLFGSDLRRFLWIKADGDDVELIADIEFDHFHRGAETC